MFAPVQRSTDDKVEYVNPTQLCRIQPHADGESILYFPDGSSLQVKGLPEQILGAWFGPPPNADPNAGRPPSRQQRRQAGRTDGGLIVPPHVGVKHGR